MLSNLLRCWNCCKKFEICIMLFGFKKVNCLLEIIRPLILNVRGNILEWWKFEKWSSKSSQYILLHCGDFSCQNQHTCLFAVESFYSTLKKLLIISIFLWYTIKRGDCMVERKIYMDKIKKLQDQKTFKHFEGRAWKRFLVVIFGFQLIFSLLHDIIKTDSGLSWRISPWERLSAELSFQQKQKTGLKTAVINGKTVIEAVI